MILSLGIWEEEDNIAIDRNIPCVVYTYMPMTGLAKKKDGASESGVASKPASQLYSDERGGDEVLQEEVLEYKDYEYEGKFENPP